MVSDDNNMEKNAQKMGKLKDELKFIKRRQDNLIEMVEIIVKHDIKKGDKLYGRLLKQHRKLRNEKTK